METQRREKRAKRPADRRVLTEDSVLRLRPKRKQYLVWDGSNGRGGEHVVRGLAVLVSPAGAKSFRSYYYFPGTVKPKSRTLGRVGEMTLAEARKQCRDDRGNAREGKDPRSDNPSRSDSYEAAVEEYITRVQRNAKKRVSADECRRVLLKHYDGWSAWDDWRQRPIATIRATEIQRRLELLRDGDPKIGRKPRGYAANVLHARLRPFFAWCASPAIGKLKASPMVGIEKPFGGEKRRERSWFDGAAADEAIRTLWLAADKVAPAEGVYVKMLLLTGKRKSALAAMRWEQIDPDWYWTPPAPRSSTKRLHGVPLPKLAQRLLHPRQQTGFVFPATRDSQRPLAVKGDVLRDKLTRAGAIPDFFLHATRHLAESKLAELKIAPHIRDLLFDHAKHGTGRRVYDHHSYRDEMRDALERWGDHIERLVAPAEGVTRLR